MIIILYTNGVFGVDPSGGRPGAKYIMDQKFSIPRRRCIYNTGSRATTWAAAAAVDSNKVYSYRRAHTYVKIYLIGDGGRL